MKKIVVMVFILLISFVLQAESGSFYISALDTYDRSTGLYYKAVFNNSKGGSDRSYLSKSQVRYVSDVFIYNPRTKNSTKFFNDGKDRRITSFLFESRYDSTSKKMYFNNSRHTGPIKNNYNVRRRTLKNIVLLSVHNETKKTTSLWKASKNGKNLKRLITFKHEYKWHIDIKNSRIVIVQNVGKTFVVKNLVW